MHSLAKRAGFLRLSERKSALKDQRFLNSASPRQLAVAAGALAGHVFACMLDVKDTPRATVRLTFDGRVIKTFRGPKADERFANEVRVLRHLEARGCPFVPRLLEADPSQLKMVTTNCGSRVEHLDEARTRELFDELLKYGVRHDDPEMRNVTYRNSDGRFCLVDFEFASILPDREAGPDATAK